MRQWALWIVEFIVGLVLMAASFQWFPFPFNLVVSLGISFITALFLAPRVTVRLADYVVDFIYSTNSPGLGEDYDVEKAEAQFQRLWFGVKTTWYVALYLAIFGLAWSMNGLLDWQRSGGEEAMGTWQVVALIVCSLLWLHFIWLHFLPQLEQAHRRWMEGTPRQAADQEDGKDEAGEASETLAAHGDETGEGEAIPKRELRDPFYKENQENR